MRRDRRLKRHSALGAKRPKLLRHFGVLERSIAEQDYVLRQASSSNVNFFSPIQSTDSSATWEVLECSKFIIFGQMLSANV